MVRHGTSTAGIPIRRNFKATGRRLADKASIALRPFEVVLLEVVPHGQAASLKQSFAMKSIPTRFVEMSRPLDVNVSIKKPKPPALTLTTAGPASLRIRGEVPASQHGGLLVICTQMTKGSTPVSVPSPGQFLSAKGTVAGQTIACRPVLGTVTYPASWQAWRITLEPSSKTRSVELEITSSLPNDAKLKCSGHFLPR